MNLRYDIHARELKIGDTVVLYESRNRAVSAAIGIGKIVEFIGKESAHVQFGDRVVLKRCHCLEYRAKLNNNIERIQRGLE